MKKILRILKYAKNYKSFAYLNVLFNILSIVFSLFSFTLLIPFLDLIFQKSENDYLSYIEKGKPVFSISADYVIDSFYFELSDIIISNPDDGKYYALLFICALVFVMVLLKNVTRYFAQFYIANLRNGIMFDLRNDLFKKTTELPLSYYSEEKKGDIISRMTNDVQEIEWTAMTSIEMIFRDPLTILLFLGMLLYMSPELTLFVLILLPLSGALIGRVGKSLKKNSDKGQRKMGELVSAIEETLSGLRIIKAFNASNYTVNKFKNLNESYRNFMIRMYRKRDLASPLSEFLGVSVIVIIVWYGGTLILSEDGELTASKFIGYIVLFSQLIPPAKSITTAYFNVQKGAASAERIETILDADNPIQDAENAIEKTSFENEICFKNVSFRYSESPVLQKINLTIQKGKTIALVGPSGGGKSTLVDLVSRFYDINSGELLIDNVPVNKIKLHDLRKLMGIVTQESILFNDTIFNNIAFGLPHASEKDVIEAAKIANAHEFITQLPNGYYTNIGDRGGKLSGGQKQRISIARAVLKNPPILILDEATSALDTESERLVQEALNNLMKNRTSLVIAHRLSTIQNADEIVVLDKGEIVERGSHTDLVSQNGLYKKLHDLQSFV